MSDGDKTVRVVSFQPRLRKDVEEAYKTKREVAIKNCSVKRNRSDTFEILANSNSSITNSPKSLESMMRWYVSMQEWPVIWEPLKN